ncbi:hypothetical protein JCM16418A_15760 [Paenibacillus pini]|nr:hypothetical protein [Paenibacillus pini]
MLDILNEYDAYILEKLVNSYGYTLTVWNGYGLSIHVEGGT